MAAAAPAASAAGAAAPATRAPPTVQQRLRADIKFADITLDIGKAKLAAHSCVIGARCAELIGGGKTPEQLQKRLAKRQYGKHQAIEIAHKQVTETALKNLLTYLYTGAIELDAMPVDDKIELYVAAHAYKIERLMWLVRSHMQAHYKMETIFKTLRSANQYKVDVLKNDCVAFSLQNFSDFIGNQQGVKELGVDLFQEVVARHTNKEVVNADVGAEPPNTLLHDYQQIYEKSIYSDATAQCKDEKVKFHTAILGVSSEFFAQLFLAKGEPSGGYDFKTLSGAAFKSLLRFLYFGDQNIAPLVACELVNPSRDPFQLPELHALTKSILEKNVNETTAIEILKQCGLPNATGYKQINENAIDFVVRNLATLDISDIRKLEVRQGQFVATQLVEAIQAYQKHNPAGASAAAPAAAAAAAAGSPAAAAAADSDSSKKDPASVSTSGDLNKKVEAHKTDSKTDVKASASAGAASPTDASRHQHKEHKDHKSDRKSDKKERPAKKDVGAPPSSPAPKPPVPAGTEDVF